MTPFITRKLGDAHEGIKLTLRKVTEKSCSLGFCSAGMAARAAELLFVTLNTRWDRPGVQVPGVPHVVVSHFSS